jgi:hypothetical protein
MIQIAGMNPGEFSVLSVLRTRNLSSYLKPRPAQGFVAIVVASFALLNYGARNGTLSILNPNIGNLAEHWEISYFLCHSRLAAGNVSVPDRGSTLILLTLGVLVC